MMSLDASFWKETIDSEMNSIMSNNTWFLTDFPPGTIGCKWIFRKKIMKRKGTDDSIEKFKARLVWL